MTDEQLDLINAAPAAAQRRAGQHARATQRRVAHRAIVKVVAPLLPLVLAIALLGFGWATCVIEVALIFGIVMVDRAASTLVDRWGRGAAGEEMVGEALDGLREHGWFALHDVGLGRGNIDHVLVGPAGIFTIETKSHQDGYMPPRSTRACSSKHTPRRSRSSVLPGCGSCRCSCSAAHT